MSVHGEEGQKRAGRRLSGAFLLFLLPALFTAAFAAVSVASYDEVVFNPDEYVVEAPVVELQLLDLPEERGGVATYEIWMPDEALAGVLIDGTYTGVALCGEGNDEDWKPYYIMLDIEVVGGKVEKVSRVEGDSAGVIDPAYWYDAAENSLYLNRALDGTGGRFSQGALRQMQAFIAEGASVGGVDTVSGSTYTVLSIAQAFNRAIDEALTAYELANPSAVEEGEAEGGSSGRGASADDSEKGFVEWLLG